MQAKKRKQNGSRSMKREEGKKRAVWDKTKNYNWVKSEAKRTCSLLRAKETCHRKKKTRWRSLMFQFVTFRQLSPRIIPVQPNRRRRHERRRLRPNTAFFQLPKRCQSGLGFPSTSTTNALAISMDPSERDRMDMSFEVVAEAIDGRIQAWMARAASRTTTRVFIADSVVARDRSVRRKKYLKVERNRNVFAKSVPSRKGWSSFQDDLTDSRGWIAIDRDRCRASNDQGSFSYRIPCMGSDALRKFSERDLPDPKSLFLSRAVLRAASEVSVLTSCGLASSPQSHDAFMYSLRLVLKPNRS